MTNDEMKLLRKLYIQQVILMITTIIERNTPTFKKEPQFLIEKQSIENYIEDIRFILQGVILPPNSLKKQEDIVKSLNYQIKEYKNYVMSNLLNIFTINEVSQIKHFIRISNRSLIDFEIELTLQLPIGINKTTKKTLKTRNQ